MSYYIVNEKTLALPENFNGIAVFFTTPKDQSEKEEQQVLFQRLFENGLGMKAREILWVAHDVSEPAFTLKNKDKINCTLFFGVEPAQAGFRMQLSMNTFAAVNNIQVLHTLSPAGLNQKPEMKKVLWDVLQVLK